MKSKITLGFLLCLSAFFMAFIAQDESLKKLLDNLDNYQQSHPQEKLYLHTDKPYYAVGDDIWFKAYLVTQNLKPSGISNLTFVELVNPKNKVIKRIRVSLFAGMGWGNFTLADTLKEGNYRLRAYTNWMRNFGEEFYYDQTFKVGDIRGSQAILETNYNLSEDGNINAKLKYKNIDGSPYGNKEVNYNIEVGGKIQDKGKTTTNEVGIASINFKNKNDVAQQGILNASLKLSEETIIDKFVPISGATNDISLQFFPEGGEMVDGLRSKIAFKALGSNGMGVNISGLVKDETGDPVAKINAQNKGMGAFLFTALAGKTYHAEINMPDGSTKNYPLPQPKAEGLVMSLVTSPKRDSLWLRVMANTPYIQKNLNKNFTLIAQGGGQIIFSAAAALNEKGGFVLKFPNADFPLGISQLTLFNPEMQPVAERLFFNNKKDILGLTINADKPTYKPREKTNLNLHVSTPSGKPLVGSFSVAVINENTIPVKEEEENTIFSTLLLKSDLAGYIEDPNYYFYQQDDKKLTDLDLLLLTQGWRRYKWENILNNSFPPIVYQPEKTLGIRGRVFNNKKPIQNGKITVFSTSGGLNILQATTNDQGDFSIDSLFFTDSTKFAIQARTDKGRKFVEIEMSDVLPDEASKNLDLSALNANINASMLGYLRNSKTQYEVLLNNGLAERVINLKEVKIVDEKKKVENSDNLNGAGNADYVIGEDKLATASTMEMAIQFGAPGVQIRNGEVFFSRNGANAAPAQIIYDGMYMESDVLSTINPSDVATIEILKNPSYTAIYGGRGSGGVIVITSKRGDGARSGNTYTPGLITYMPLGYFMGKDFYVPAYDQSETNKDMPDLRSTIYWNPRMVTDSLGNAKVNYFNADTKGSCRVVVEGMDIDGHLGRQLIRYKVN